MVAEVVKTWDDLFSLMSDVEGCRDYLLKLDAYAYEVQDRRIYTEHARYYLKDANGNEVEFPLRLISDVKFIRD